MSGSVETGRPSGPFADPRGPAAERTEPVETLRALAVLMLVSYHVIGGSPGNGLQIDYPHPLRILNDLLVDFRMPAFAFVAGYVYAIRPVGMGEWGRFVSGKFRRLLIPGAVAATLFVIMANLFDTPFGRDGDTFWRIYVYPYAHYWFLQAIFLIFTVLAFVEARTGPRTAWALLAISIPFYFADVFMPGNLFSTKQAFYLAPYFLCGVIYYRYLHVFRQHRWIIGILCLVTIVVSLWLNLSRIEDQGFFSRSTRDLQSLALGMTAPVFLMLCLPNWAPLTRFGAASFTIYLYHVFATSASRRVFDSLGMDGGAFVIVAGILAGILLPIALHILAERNGLTRRLVLGQRR
ncbi:acyltransferase family protein [Jannaschia sp. W003]|uniref:acyltransferase family protein n=1 Tax=Jannaschia sp. W003 TaxID=2867012 RepID=UPI0021A6BBB5|nr:acyltransferase [Jannaschia sp. W003]UWQ23184.1 acyltransferase [Jannaschia sp. W003]